MANFSEKIITVIEKARERSEHARHLIALTISGVITLIIFLIWAFILIPARLNDVKVVQKDTENSPFRSFKAQVSGMYDDFLKSIKGNSTNSDALDGSLLQNQYQKIKSQVQSTQSN